MDYGAEWNSGRSTWQYLPCIDKRIRKWHLHGNRRTRSEGSSSPALGSIEIRPVLRMWNKPALGHATTNFRFECETESAAGRRRGKITCFIKSQKSAGHTR